MSTATGETPGKRAPRKRKSASPKKKVIEHQAGNGAADADVAERGGEDQPDAIEIHGGPGKDAPKADVIAWLAELPPTDRTKELLAAAKKRLGITITDIREAIKEEIRKHEKAERDRLRAGRVQQGDGFTIFGGNMAPGQRPQPKPDPDGVIWPSGFTMKDSGLWYEPPPKDNGEERDSEKIAAPFRVVARTSNDQHEEHGLLLRWADHDWHPHQWAMPKNMVHLDGNAIAAELELAGLSCRATRTAHEQLKNFMSEVRSVHHVRCVDRAGWLDAGFILPNSEIIDPEGEHHE
jgi:hypothetical protein